MSARGFSLIELLISTAIIVAVAAVVIVRFSTFDSATLLKSVAYEIAATIREAQVHSVSVLGANPNFRYPYGVTFAPGSDSYTAFVYESSDRSIIPEYNILSNAIVSIDEVGTYTIGRSMHIVETCVMISSVENCDVGRLDISFRRPEFKALFHAVPGSGGSITDSDIESAQIKLQSRNGGDKWVVSVGLLGNVSVYREL